MPVVQLCPRCHRAKPCACPPSATRNHWGRSAAARGYGRPYQRQRAMLVGEPCAMRLPGCTGVATTAQHTDDGRLVPACGHCNYRDGARRAFQPWHGREVVALMGPPGSGKSTYAQGFAHVVTTDAIRRGALAADIYPAALDALVEHLRANRRVVFDAMLSRPATRRQVLALAHAHHARARLVVFTTPLAECITRQAGRGHPVPASQVARWHARIAEQHTVVTSEGWDAVEWRDASSRGMASAPAADRDDSFPRETFASSGRPGSPP